MTCNMKWSMLSILLLVVLSVCVYILFQKQAYDSPQKQRERNQVRESFFPKEAPLYVNNL